MKNVSSTLSIGLLSLLLLTSNSSNSAIAQDAPYKVQLSNDLAPFRAIAVETLAMVNAGDLRRAKVRVKDLETSWDEGEPKLRPSDPERWQMIDKAIDMALTQLRADRPQQSASKEALQNLLSSLDQPSKTGAAAKPTTLESTKLSVTDIIAAVEKLQLGANVLDVSYEPKDGRPIYAVRAFVYGKVWDVRMNGTTGVALDQGAMMDESALDAEDKAELSALKTAKITLVQAIASAEKAAEGRALNAGLEQVRGRAVWEVLIQNTAESQQVHIDPDTGIILGEPMEQRPLSKVETNH